MMSSGEGASDCQKRWVKLNVGGTTFLTTWTTLARYPGSFLHRLCQEDSGLKTDKDESGAYLVDRNPNYFAPVLDFLRHGELIMDAQIPEEGVMKEADFFGLPELIRLVEAKIQDKLKARMAELMLEKKLGSERQQEEPKTGMERQARGFDDERYFLSEAGEYINKQFRKGWKLDEIKQFPPKYGTLVIMSKQQTSNFW